jgi:glycerophosphoryl diester phosphodiesterase
MHITGHRGASATQPENTLASFRAALAMGATALEFDIRRCKSGEMVVIHDETIDRTSNGSGRVQDMSLRELRRFDFGNGERIATLDEVLMELAGKCRDGSNPHLFIELKSPGGKSTAATINNNVADQRYRYDEITVIGFSHPQLFQFKRQNPQIETGLSFAAKNRITAKAMVPLAKRLGASAINPEHSLITPELVQKAHAAGLKVNAWTVNGHADIKRMNEAGVDALMSDHPDRARNISQATARPSPSSIAV